MQSRIMELRGTDGIEVFKALASEMRTSIIALLAGSPMNINALGQILAMERSRNAARLAKSLVRGSRRLLR